MENSSSLRVIAGLYKKFITKDRFKIFKYAYMVLKSPSLVNKFIAELKLNGLDYAVYKLKNFEPVVTNLSTRIDDKTKNKILNYISNNQQKEPIILFSHDLSRLGAQIILLNIARSLFNKHNRSIILITLKGGELYKDFTDFCAVINLEQNTIKHIQNEELIENLISFLAELSINQAILNTLCGGLLIPYLEKHLYHYLILIHELFESIKFHEWDKNILPLLNQISEGSKLIFSAENTYSKFISNTSLPLEKLIFPQGCEFINYYPDTSTARKKLRAQLKIPQEAKIILGAGKGFHRKGIDLFYEIACESDEHDLYFLWLGDTSDPQIRKIIKNNKNGLSSGNINIIFKDFVKEPSLFFAGSDIFILTSREDTFPNVVLDSLTCGIPALAFADCGGAPEILNKIDRRLIVNKFDTTDFVQKIKFLLNDRQLYKEISAKAVKLIADDYKFEDYVNNLLVNLDKNIGYQNSQTFFQYNSSEKQESL